MAEPTEVEHGPRRWWLLLLLIPFIVSLWPPFYARLDPTLAGIPFFYWFQFLWVLISAAITGLVYVMVTE